MIADLVIPPWVRIAAVAACVAGVFASGMWVERKSMAGEVAEAKQETAETRADVAEAGNKQAAETVQTVIKQAETNNKTVSNYAKARSSLDARIAAGSVRSEAGVCGKPASAAPAVADGSTPSASESVPADDGRDAGLVQAAARDALQAAAVIQWACDQGMCK